MSYNLFIAYDLMSPGQNYDAVQRRIMDLGPFHKFQYSLFYVHSSLTPEQAYAHIAGALDGNDRLAVINAQSGVVTNWDHPPIDAINAIWSQP